MALHPIQLMLWSLELELTKVQVHALSGHDSTICLVFTWSTDPQVLNFNHLQ